MNPTHHTEVTMKPIPVPPKGSAVLWKLDQPYQAKHFIFVLLILVLLIYTGKRTEMDRMLSMTGQAIG
ncbi:MAG: hypothetical protein K2P84_07970, partial [Undibacterium sp.]|nr:hypothetical protein [Undibacterium sp.]